MSKLQAENTPVKYGYYLLFAVSFILYGNTINHEYALDDAIVITQNQYTKKGFRGIPDIFTHDTFTGFFGEKKNLVSGGRYRPLSLVTFAIEYQLFGENPNLSHLINVLLYALNVMLIYKILLLLFDSYKSKKWFFTIPFLSALIYLVHPIHTEVVSNIKGRDEIMTFLGSLMALYYSILYSNDKKYKYLIFSGISLFLGLLSKENAITFLAIIPLSIYFFRKTEFKELVIIFIPLVFASILFLILRYNFIGNANTGVASELMNNPFLYATVTEKFATIFYTFLIYFKLIIFPHPLTFDYYPKHIPIVDWSFFPSIAALIICIGLGIYALLTISKKSIYSYSIWFYFISFSIVSNLFFPIGTFMNERFLYISSLGFAIALAYFVYQLLQKKSLIKNITITALSAILILFSIKTISRNKVWKNDFTLFTHDVNISTNSAKSNTSAGGKLLEEATKKGNEELREKYLKQSIAYLEKAIEIHPTYIDALLLLGNAWYEYNKNYDKVFEYYFRILDRNPKYPQVFSNTDIILNNLDSTEFKIKIWEKLHNYNPDNFETNYNLGNLYGRYKNDLDKSLIYLENAVKIRPNNYKVWKDMGVAYGIKKDYENSARCLENALKYNPKDAQTYFNLGITYLSLGKKKKSDESFKKAAALDPEIKTKLGI